MTTVPLAVLDLMPITEGTDARTALDQAKDLARQAEAFGYQRYWVAEHHLNPGVAGTSPAVALALIGTSTCTIRLGSAATLLGHRTPLSVVEEFGLLDSAYPGRIDLGLGRSGGRAPQGPPATGAKPKLTAAPEQQGNRTAPSGLVLPPPFSPAALLTSPRFGLQQQLLQQPGAQTPDYAEQVDDLARLLAGSYVSDGIPAQPVPGAGADLQVWVLGSSPGQSATVAGNRGLRFAANYHVAPSAVVDAVDAYRTAFRPSAELDRPYVSVSADVVVGDDDTHARELATGYGLWVRSIRSGAGAIPFPSPGTARRHHWNDADRALVQDRLDTQFVGSAQTVTARLHQLQEATGADELAITTITHRHADRIRSYQLLAQAWFNCGNPAGEWPQ